jgi:hydroxymethylpyrimidine/phosphomethylpyrimidine kinase
MTDRYELAKEDAAAVPPYAIVAEMLKRLAIEAAKVGALRYMEAYECVAAQLEQLAASSEAVSGEKG